jgi:hypothetical protein
MSIQELSGGGADMTMLANALASVLQSQVGRFMDPAWAGQNADLLDLNKWRDMANPGQLRAGVPWQAQVKKWWEGDKDWWTMGVGKEGQRTPIYRTSKEQPGPEWKLVPPNATSEGLFAQGSFIPSGKGAPPMQVPISGLDFGGQRPSNNPSFDFIGELAKAIGSSRNLPSGQPILNPSMLDPTYPGPSNVPNPVPSDSSDTMRTSMLKLLLPLLMKQVQKTGSTPIRQFHGGGAIDDLRNMITLDAGEVPAILEKGEVVINKNAARAIGANKLNAINRAIPRYHPGGTAGQKPILSDNPVLPGSAFDIAPGPVNANAQTRRPQTSQPQKKTVPQHPPNNLDPNTFYTSKAARVYGDALDNFKTYDDYLKAVIGPEYMIQNADPAQAGAESIAKFEGLLPGGTANLLKSKGLTGWSPMAEMKAWMGNGRMGATGSDPVGLSTKWFDYKAAKDQGYLPQNTVWLDRRIIGTNLLPNNMRKGYDTIVGKDGKPIVAKGPNGAEWILVGQKEQPQGTAPAPAPAPVSTVTPTPPVQPPGGTPPNKGEGPQNTTPHAEGTARVPFSGPVVEQIPQIGGAAPQSVATPRARLTPEGAMPQIDYDALSKMDSGQAMEYLRQVASGMEFGGNPLKSENPQMDAFNMMLEQYGKGSAIDLQKAQVDYNKENTIHQKIVNAYDQFTAPQRAAAVKYDLEKSALDNFVLKYSVTNRKYMDATLQKPLLDLAETQARIDLLNKQGQYYLAKAAAAGTAQGAAQITKNVTAWVQGLKAQVDASRAVATATQFKDTIYRSDYLRKALAYEFAVNPIKAYSSAEDLLQEFQKKGAFGIVKSYLTIEEIRRAQAEIGANPNFQLIVRGAQPDASVLSGAPTTIINSGTTE